MSWTRVQGREDHELLELVPETKERGQEVCPSSESTIFVCASLLVFKAVEGCQEVCVGMSDNIERGWGELVLCTFKLFLLININCSNQYKHIQQFKRFDIVHKIFLRGNPIGKNHEMCFLYNILKIHSVYNYYWRKLRLPGFSSTKWMEAPTPWDLPAPTGRRLQPPIGFLASPGSTLSP